MPDESTSNPSGRLRFDRDGYAKVERLVAYEVGNSLLMLNLELQRAFGLRAEEYQIFMLIVFATVQRFARDSNQDERYIANQPLPPEYRRSISRRRISETLGIPLETVRRTTARLLDRRMIEERQRGQLSTKGGTLKLLSEKGVSEDIAARFLRVANGMVELGAAEISR